MIYLDIKELYIFTTGWLVLAILQFGPIIAVSLLFVPIVKYFMWAYLIWIYIDRKTIESGRGLKVARKFRFWQYFNGYFSTKLIKTADLPANRTYLLASFPHGIASFGILVNICSDVTGFDEKFPGLNPHLHSVKSNFFKPFARDVILTMGWLDVSEKSILKLLNGPVGNTSVISPEGISGSMISSSRNNNILKLKNRKGFVRVALKAGSSLVPVYNFNEMRTFDQPSSSWYTHLQEICYKYTGFPLVLFLGRYFTPIPKKRMITTVVGKPINLPKVENPSVEIIDHYHQIFIKELKHLFDQFKCKYDDDGEHANLLIE